MISWPASYYNSWQLFGHHHSQTLSDFQGHDNVEEDFDILNKLRPTQFDVGVDGNKFYPYSYDEILKIINNQIKENGSSISYRKK